MVFICETHMAKRKKFIVEQESNNGSECQGIWDIWKRGCPKRACVKDFCEVASQYMQNWKRGTIQVPLSWVEIKISVGVLIKMNRLRDFVFDIIMH